MLKCLKYKGHFDENDIRPFLPATFVRSSTGTGLVHVAPAHGPDDFALASKCNLSMVVFQFLVRARAVDFFCGYIVEF